MSFCKVKNNPNSGETELWIDDEFQASWGVTLRLSLASGDKLCSICALVAYTEYRDEAIAVYDEFIDALLSNRPDIN